MQAGTLLQPRSILDRPARIGLVAAYMPYFDEIMPAGFRASMAARGAERAEWLKGLGEVCYPELVLDEATGEAAGRQLTAFDPDAIVVAPSMAAPAGFQWAALRYLGSTPLVILNIHDLDTIPPSYSAASIVLNSGNVGAMMINNILRREGRHAAVVTGHNGDDGTWRRAREMVAAAIVAGRLRKARFGVLGSPLAGYANVVCDPDALCRSVGCRLVNISAGEFTEAFLALPEGATAELSAEFAGRYRLDIPADDPDFVASVRLSLALRTIAERHDLQGGTFNCRNEYGVGNPVIGVLGCLANSYLTTEGRPFTCTGDIITAIAMFLGKRLGGDSYYCELDTIDYARDAVLCANTGEGDFCQAADAVSCVIRRSGEHSGRRSPGCNVLYRMPKRPGTAIAFTPRANTSGGHVIIVAEGDIDGTPDTALSLPSMYFRFRNGPASDAINRWIAAGSTHHTGISSGLHAAALRLIADFLGIGFEEI